LNEAAAPRSARLTAGRLWKKTCICLFKRHLWKTCIKRRQVRLLLCAKNINNRYQQSERTSENYYV